MNNQLLTLEQLSEIIQPINLILSSGGQKQCITGISTDTRTLKEGEVFVALRGDNFDGHNFLEIAEKKGAIALITETIAHPNITQFQVKETLAAYQKIAHWWRQQFKIPVMAITGSVGKTTTKELLAEVLATQGKVLKTQANYNNEIGVPQTLLALNPDHDYAVIEMAMRGPGEIAQLTEIANPTIGIITNVGTAHIGRLGSVEAIALAKCELLGKMSPDSVAILNQDNELLMETAAKVWRGKTITYGFNGGDLSGKLINSQTLKVEGIDLPLPLPGRHNALNYLAALAVAKVLKIDFNSLKKGISVTLPGGRSRRYELPNNVIILDETYNAGLESMIAALKLLKETPGERHLAILGTMKELGERSPQFHYQVGETVKSLGIDSLLLLIDDPETGEIAHGAKPIPTESFNNHETLFKRLKEIVKQGDRLLFKASHSVGLGQVVNEFLSLYPSQEPKLF
ncbi:MAG: UDP-N-acetylmuramoyl-tripeptide--D-alanyl-D-alanine ligase [Gomphosphaeria aponina SAG 52.96 = DSM 107014]|uniref:UDP-N-acetylmuramoyl-tripeptide--D-alanyl-D-alanine ligase n=1 Tax=Gomphosphaeria aponina SAG 52.96 = DSM 107014 TaxID=1521640 RepID=A0A941GTU6_9CHRO|nr:UDP-N-acetylmuramoyl-tripeptide--D-alanyl-D-alanine ligase [Gomphosphaeria aponina SAG 52.96 = DSM 107014]